MPITVTVNAAERVRYSVFAGTICDADVVDVYRRTFEAPDLDPSLDGLVDLRAVRELAVTPAGLERVAMLLRKVDALGGSRRVAIVATADATFGMGRMFEAFRATRGSCTEYRVFRDMAEARQWLGLKPEPRAAHPAA